MRKKLAKTLSGDIILVTRERRRGGAKNKGNK